MIYFPVRARAECARMIVAYGDIPNYSDTDCQAYFGCDFMTAKTEGKLPFGQLPVLAVDDKTLIGQSGSINRYLASLVKKEGFLPSDPVKAALTDALHETAQDLWKAMPIVNFWRGETWQKEKDEFYKTTLPAKLPGLVKMLGAQQYFTGETVTYADFALYVIMDLVRLVEPGVISQHNNVTSWMARVEQLPGVKNYLETRPLCIGIGVSPKLQPRN